MQMLKNATPWIRVLSKRVIYSGNFSEVATRNAFYFYGDLVPKDKETYQKEQLLLHYLGVY